LPQPLPLTLGADLSGEVAAVGPGVASLAGGDAVFGNTNPRFTGAHAEYAIATAAMLARAPTTLSDAQAASVPVVAVTAWQALFEQAKVAHGQTVLVHGAAGSVGAYAVQLAHHAGLHVIATAGAADVDEVRRLGADSVLDYRATRFEDVVPSVDSVVDLVGGEAQRRSFAVLKPGGTLVSAVSEPEQAMAARHGVTAMFFLVNVTSAHLARIGDLLGQGVLSPRVGAVLPLAAARTAHEMLEGSRPRPRGRIVLQIAA
jgi:NADPH:quinone reductase-like Zn-dependent oxidoreductase